MRTKTKCCQSSPEQSLLTITPHAAMAAIEEALTAKGYQVLSLQANDNGRYSAYYFPKTLNEGKGAFHRQPYDDLLIVIGKLPDAPRMDTWTRLSVEKGRQGGIYMAEAAHDRFISGGQCMDCRVLSPVTTRGDGLAKVALCGYCAADFDRRTPTRAAADAELMIEDSIDDDTLITFL